MSASLIEQLAARLGISPEEAERSLQTFIAHFHEEIREKGEASIPGLGVFRRDEAALSFEPAPALEIAANYRFAGMAALPVSPEPEPPAAELGDVVERDEPDATAEEGHSEAEEAPEPPEEEPVAAMEESVAEGEADGDEEETSEEEVIAEDTAEEEEIAEGAPEEAESVEATGEETPVLFAAEEFEEESFEIEEEVWEAPRDDADHPLGPLPEPEFEEADYDVVEEMEIVEETVETGDMEEEREREEATAEEEESLFNVIRFEEEESEEVEEAEKAEETVETVAEPEDETSEAGEEARPGTASEHEIETLKRAALQPPPAPPRTPIRRERESRKGLFIAIGVVAVLLGAFFAYQVLKPGPEAPETPAVAEGGTTPADTSAAAAVPMDSARTEAPSQPEPPVRRTLGGIDRSAGGWTVIVASETSREAAEAAAQPYLDLDLPVDVLRGVSGGVTRYRVGVGQFAGQSEAEAAIRRLGDRLPSGAWPLRITSRM